ncbi:MAG: lamin tail domain-containing protein [Planctomycetes bacterium]|nr:lamin tail domain-containing protein [Planctomycetota bacterium]
MIVQKKFFTPLAARCGSGTGIHGLALAALGLALLWTRPAASQVIINEIHYNPPGSLEVEEFIELWNGGEAADLSGWILSGGIRFVFPAGFVLGASEYAVVAATRDEFLRTYPGINLAGIYEGKLSNSGEKIFLADSKGAVVDQVEYNDNEDWPQEADGEGAALELIKPAAPHDFPGNWGPGRPPTPGAPNRSSAAALPPMAYDVRVNPTAVTPADQVKVSAQVFSEIPLQAITLRLFLNNFASDHAMRDDGAWPDSKAADGKYTVAVEPLPDRTLAKFKVILVDDRGAERPFPPAGDESDFYAWFVDGGSIDTPAPIILIFLSPEKLKILDDNAQIRSPGDPRYPHFDDAFPGFAVLDGRVHRKVAIRHRGGFASRHAGRLKYSWRLEFPDWDRYQGREVLVIQGNMHWDDPYQRGDNGLKDKLCYLTFDRAGVPSSRTRFIRLMVNDSFFGWHVEVEAIDETFLERNGFTGLGDLYKHGRTASAHNYPVPSYSSAYEKQSNDRADYSSIRNFVEGLAGSSSDTPGTMMVAGRIWKRDGGVRPALPTFTQLGLSEFNTKRASIGLIAYNCLAEFDGICIADQSSAPNSCNLLVENGEAIDDWTGVEGTWEAGGAIRLVSPLRASHHRLARPGIIDFSKRPITVTYDVRITSQKTGDNWAGAGLFLGDPPGHAFSGTLCPSLRYLNSSSEGLHLVNAGIRWINESGQFRWQVGEWHRVEYIVSLSEGGGTGTKGFLENNVHLELYRRYLAAIILSTHWDSTSQNYYFYQDELNGNRWVRFPWDMDITWGYSRRKPPPAQGHNLHPYDGSTLNPEPQEFMVSALRSAYLGVPEFRDQLKDTLAEALVTYFTETEIQPVIDRIQKTDGEEAQMDVDKWNALDTSWNWKGFSFHARFDKVYVSSRRKYLAEFLDREPLLSQASVGPQPAGPGDALTFTANALGSRYDGTYDLGPSNLVSVKLHFLQGGEESAVDMAAVDSRIHDFYAVAIPPLHKEARLFYCFSARDDKGREGFLPDPGRHGFEYLALDVKSGPPVPGDVVVNEIMYRARYYDIEFIELKNNLHRTMDLSGWKLKVASVAAEYVFPEGTLIEPDGFLVLSRNTRAVFEYYNIVQVAGTDLPFFLANGGDTISLWDEAGRLMDSVAYGDDPPWPEEADGGGPSLELIDSRSDNRLPGSWGASARQGSPGRPNSISGPEIPPQPGGVEAPLFHRADVDSSGALEVTDAVVLLRHLFLGDPGPACREAADANNDGALDISDGVTILKFTFLGGTPPADPGPPGEPCGSDPDSPGSPQDLGCANYPPCAN